MYAKTRKFHALAIARKGLPSDPLKEFDSLDDVLGKL